MRPVKGAVVRQYSISSWAASHIWALASSIAACALLWRDPDRDERRRSAEPRASHGVITIETARRIAALSAGPVQGRPYSVLDLDPTACCVKESAAEGSLRTATSYSPLSESPVAARGVKTKRNHCDIGRKAACCTTSRRCQRQSGRRRSTKWRAAYVAPIDAKDVDHAARSAFFAVSWQVRLIKGLLS
jgi:hypothetical protein